jgi:hypothetical protein
MIGEVVPISCTIGALVVCFHSDAPGLAMHQRVDAMEGVCRRVLAVSQCMLVTALTRFRKFLFSMC